MASPLDSPAVPPPSLSATTSPEAARRVGRDVSAVHRDIHALIDAGIMEKTDGGLVVFPYDAIRIDATLPAAAE